MASTSAPTSSESRLSARLAERLRSGRRLLVPYVTAGFPSGDETPELMHRIAAAGADVIELGVPFSDPLADGPTIQGSSQVSLDRGGSLAATLDVLRTFREADTRTPVVIFTYLNPVFRHGVDRFLDDAERAGADGLLLTDLPLGEDPELEDRFERSPLPLIRLIAPTTPPKRARRIAERAQGFVYYISRTGVTGARADLRSDLARNVRALKQAASVPVLVGFGISTPEQAAEVAALADGVVVGSALIQAIQQGGIVAAGELVERLAEALNPGR